MLRLSPPGARRSAALPGRKNTTTPAAAGKGFSSSSSSPATAKPKQQQKPKKAGPPPAAQGKPRRSGGRGALRRTEQAARLGLGTTPATPAPAGPGEWVRLARLSEWKPGKAGKAVTLPDGSNLCLFALDGGRRGVYASDVYSTAFKYPMLDATVEISPAGVPVATVSFDGTQYSLASGEVLRWCPTNTPVRALLGAMKSKAPPTPLRVYPARVAADGEGVEVWFVR